MPGTLLRLPSCGRQALPSGSGGQRLFLSPSATSGCDKQLRDRLGQLNNKHARTRTTPAALGARWRSGRPPRSGIPHKGRRQELRLRLAEATCRRVRRVQRPTTSLLGNSSQGGGCGGGLCFAFHPDLRAPTAGRIRFCDDTWVWDDGPGSPSPTGVRSTSRASRAHELGHALGAGSHPDAWQRGRTALQPVGHAALNPTMCAFACGHAASWRARLRVERTRGWSAGHLRHQARQQAVEHRCSLGIVSPLAGVAHHPPAPTSPPPSNRVKVSAPSTRSTNIGTPSRAWSGQRPVPPTAATRIDVHHSPASGWPGWQRVASGSRPSRAVHSVPDSTSTRHAGGAPWHHRHLAVDRFASVSWAGQVTINGIRASRGALKMSTVQGIVHNDFTVV
jgi:hypothetical protein